MDQLSIAHYIIVISFPAICVFSPTLAKWIKSTHIRFLVSIILAWICLDFWRHIVELPIALENAKAKGDMMYDGVGGNVAILLFGWIEPLIFGLPLYIAKLIMNKKKNPNQRLDLTVKTPVESGKPQGTAGHP